MSQWARHDITSKQNGCKRSFRLASESGPDCQGSATPALPAQTEDEHMPRCNEPMARAALLAGLGTLSFTGQAAAQPALPDPGVVQLERGRPTGMLPPGVQACDLHAWSNDTDRKGLNVRAEPSVQARVLGILLAPFQFKAASEAAPNEGYRTEFRIIGFKDGWFLIRRDASRKAVCRRWRLPEAPSSTLCWAGLCPGRYGRSAIREWRYPDGRSVGRTAGGCGVDAGK